jgi:hypothetical protein
VLHVWVLTRREWRQTRGSEEEETTTLKTGIRPTSVPVRKFWVKSGDLEQLQYISTIRLTFEKFRPRLMRT